MPRRLRDKTAGTFHVFTRCVYASPALYRDDLDRLEFLRHLGRTTSKLGWTCLGFCLMTTHYHLIVAVEDNVLPRAMHSLNLGSAAKGICSPAIATSSETPFARGCASSLSTGSGAAFEGRSVRPVRIRSST